MNEDRFSLAGKVALITGGSRGIGRAIALEYAERGADVAVVSRTAADVEAVAEEIEDRGRRGLGVAADISESSDVDGMVAQVIDIFGRVDVLVNNAGISPVYSKAVKMSEEQWREIIDVNLTGTFLVSVAVGKHMIDAGTGVVINMTSIGTRAGLSRLSAYGASKAGIEALTRVLAIEWVEHGIRVNAIGPAFVATDFTAGLRSHEYLSQKLLDQTPMRRYAEPDDIVGAAVYLASNASQYVTGETIIIDGGWLAQ